MMRTGVRGLAVLVIVGDREDARQAGEAVAAQRIVDELVGDDRRFIVGIADTPQRRLAEVARFGDAEANGVRCRPDRARFSDP